MSFQIRNFNDEDFETVKDWRVKLRWNPGLFDHLAFKTIDNNGFFIGLVDGQPIGAIGAVQYDQNFAAVGMYMIKLEHRQKGYGMKLWNKAFQRITAKTVALYGATQHEIKFKKSKFQTSHKAIRFSLKGNQLKYQTPCLIECKDLNIDDLVRFDRNIFPVQRKRFLQKWINLPQSKALAFVKQGKIQGYGVLRVSGQGYKLGPLFADNYQAANQILKGLAGQVSLQKQICLDIPEINENGLKLAREWKMVEVFDCLRMFKNQSIDVHVEKKVYGITCLQFG